MRCAWRRETLALLTGAALLLTACEKSPRAGNPPAAPPAPQAAPVRPVAARVLPLSPGVLDELDLQPGGSRAWLLDLAAGQYAELMVDQQGTDVAVRLLSADGRQTIATVDSNNGILGPEPLPVVAEAAGRYRLEVRSGSPFAGRCVLRLDALRPATRSDRARVEAERVLAASEELRQRGDPASLRHAVELEKEVLARFRALGARAREAETLFSLGRAHYGLKDPEASTGFYRQALALYRELGDGPQAGVTLANLGMLERGRGNSGAALALYREALVFHRRFHNRPEEAQVLFNLGRAAMNVGETGEALKALQQAHAIWHDLGDRNNEGKSLSNLGHLEIALGQYPMALRHLEQALAIQQAEGDLHWEGRTLARIGVARELDGRPREEVLAAFDQALAIQRQIGDRQEEAITLHNLGWYHHRKRELRQAQQIFEKTLALFAARGDRASEARALINLAGIHLDLGRPAVAEPLFSRAGAHLRELNDPEQLTVALMGVARCRRRQGKVAEALAPIEEAFARVETLRRKPVDPDLRLTYFASKEDIYELRIALLMDLWRRDPGAGYGARALTASEEARARTLLDLLAAADVEAAGSGAVLTAREIQRQVVDEETLLLEYSLGEERSFLWAVTPGSIESFELPARRVLEEEARRAAFLLASSGKALARSQAALALAGLSERLLAPVAHLLRSRQRLVIVPDGALWSLSFAALPEPGTPGNTVPLVAGHEIVVLPSASVLPRLRAAASRRPDPGTVAVLADPVFDAADPRVTRSRESGTAPAGARSAGPALPRLQRLPYARAEAEAILSLVPRPASFSALDFAASRETVLSGRLAEYRIVHFATHALVDTEHPERSGIALSRVDPQGRPRRGFLSLQEIYRLRLPADLVVLSACRTGLGRELPGEGLVGLTRGFFSAGARQVVVSLWPVEDRATAELMRRFYGEMLDRGLPPAAALREAQASLWRDESRRAPYDWAGFILQGDWRVSLNKPFPPAPDLSSHAGRKTSSSHGGPKR